MADLTNAREKGMGKDIIPPGEPHPAGDSRQGGLLTRDGVKLGALREVGGTEGGYHPDRTGTGGESLPSRWRRSTGLSLSRPEGERYATSKEADILGKLAAAISKMEQEIGIADTISVLTGLIEWVRYIDIGKAKELTGIADAYIKDKL